MAEDLTDRPARLVTLRDVAARAEVPLSAASLVLNGKSGVSDERKRRVLQAVDELGYVPQQQKRAGPAQQQAVIGLIMETLSPSASQDGFMAEVVSGVEQGLRSAGSKMLLHLYRRDDDPVSDLRGLMGRDVDGMIITNGGDIDEAVITGILQAGVPTVLLENYLDALVHAVVADNFAAGYRSTAHLIALGHRRIGMLAGSGRYISLVDRRRGYEAALLEAGLTLEPQLVPPQAPGVQRKGYQQMKLLLELPERPTAVYAVSDRSAMGAYAAIAEAGLTIPGDISVIGTDDVAESAFLSPPLSTFHIPKFELGRTAAQMITALLGSHPPAPSRTILLGTLQQRGSTQSPRPVEA